MAKLKLCVTLDEDVVQAVSKKAREDRRSVSAYINMVLLRHTGLWGQPAEEEPAAAS